MRKRAEEAATRVEPYAAAARETAGKRVSEAREWAAPRLESAAGTVQETIAPKVTAGLNTASQRLEPTRKEAKRRGVAAAQALRGEKVKKRRRWTVALLFFGIGTAIGTACAVLARKPEALEEARGRLSSVPRPPRPAPSPDDEVQGARKDERTSVDGQPRR